MRVFNSIKGLARGGCVATLMWTAGCGDPVNITSPDIATPGPDLGPPDLAAPDLNMADMATLEAALDGFTDPTGTIKTLSDADGGISRANPFFTAIGTNLQTCEDCHFQSDGWGLSLTHVDAIFAANPQHPLFSFNAGNDPRAIANLSAPSTADLQKAFSLLLNHGLAMVRVAFVLPAADTANCRLAAMTDPTLPPSVQGMTITLPNGVVGIDPVAFNAYSGGFFWYHRRPLPTANFQFDSGLSWDNHATPTPEPTTAPSIQTALVKLSHDTILFRLAPDSIAVDGHTLSDAEVTAFADQMTDFMNTVTVAQSVSATAGPLDADGALGGVVNLFAQSHYFGMNDLLQGDFMTMMPFSPNVMTMFQAWEDDSNPNRAQVARGEALFNALRLTITGVGGLNDATISLPADGPSGAGKTTVGPNSITGSCSSCHDQPGAGNHSTRLTLNIGISDPLPLGLDDYYGVTPGLAEFPIYTYHKGSWVNGNWVDADWTDPTNTMQVTDPGRAANSGQWADLGGFKVPVLRGLAARAPYFHNGLPLDLEHVVKFYNKRFSANFTADEQADLVAFLKTL